MNTILAGAAESRQNRSVAEQVVAHLGMTSQRVPLVAIVSEAKVEDEIWIIDQIETQLHDRRLTVTRTVSGGELVRTQRADGTVLIVENAGHACLPEHALYEPVQPTLLVIDLETCAGLTRALVPAKFVHLGYSLDREAADVRLIAAAGGRVGLMFAALRIPVPEAWLDKQHLLTAKDTGQPRNATHVRRDAVLFDIDRAEGRDILAHLGEAGIEDVLRELLQARRDVTLPMLLALIRGLSESGHEFSLAAVQDPLARTLATATATATPDDIALASRLMLEAGLATAAQRLLERSSEPRSPAVLLQRARLAAAQGQMQEARERIKPLAATREGQWLDLTLQREGLLLGRVQERETVLQRIIARDPSNIAAQLFTGLEAAAQGRRTAVEEIFSRTNLATAGHSVVLSAWSNARALLGDIDGADERLDNAQAQEVWNPAHYLAEAELAVARGAPERAERVLRTAALALAPGWPPALEHLAAVHSRLEDPAAVADDTAALGQTTFGIVTTTRAALSARNPSVALSSLRVALARAPALRRLHQALNEVLETGGRTLAATFGAVLTPLPRAENALAASADSAIGEQPLVRVTTSGKVSIALSISPTCRTFVTVEAEGRAIAGAMITVLDERNANGQLYARVFTDAGGDADIGPADLARDIFDGSARFLINVHLPPDSDSIRS